MNNPAKVHLRNETDENTALNVRNNSDQSRPTSNIKVVLEPDSRKMQAEKPLLLQDLSQSRLLQKFKQEMETNNLNNESKQVDEKTNNLQNLDECQNKNDSKETDENCVYGADFVNINTKPLFVLTSSPKLSNNNSPERKIDKTCEFSKLNDQTDDFERSYLEKASKEINEPDEKMISIIQTSPVRQEKPFENELNTGACSEMKNPRKPVFNPLHVILKDKNKYHTTEFI